MEKQAPNLHETSDERFVRKQYNSNSIFANQTPTNISNARATYSERELTPKQQKMRDKASRYMERAGGVAKYQGREMNQVGKNMSVEKQRDSTLPLRAMGAGLFVAGASAKGASHKIANTAKVASVSALTLGWSSFWWFLNAALSVICIFFLALASTIPAGLGDAAISFTVLGYPIETVWGVFALSWAALIFSVSLMYIAAIMSYRVVRIHPLEGSLQALSFLFSFIINIIPGMAAIFHWMSIWIFTVNIYSKVEG